MHRKRMNLQQQEQFYQVMTRLRGNSRAASLPEAEIRVNEMDSNGVLIIKPLKKVEEITEAKATTTKEARVWRLTPQGPILEQESKAASVQGINKLKAIQDFIHSNGRI
jgi:hypothetical protein